MSLVSVIVPVYNQGAYLPGCLDALLFQEYAELEIVVVNDGSPDDTPAIIEDYLAGFDADTGSYASRYDASMDRIDRVVHSRFPRVGRTIKVVTHPENMGLATALNTGFRACSGVYCTYVPADDIAHPHMVSTLVAALEEHDADFAFADMFVVSDTGRIVRRFSLPTYSFKACFEDWYLCGVCKLYRRSLHDAHGYYDESLLAHDHEIFQRFAMAGAAFVHVPRVLMSILDHSGARAVDIHAPQNWNRLLLESKKLVLQAREYATRVRQRSA